MNKKNFTYKKSGVNIAAADNFINFISLLSSKKKGKKKFSNIGGFGSISNIPKNIRNPKIVACTDGVGTKVKLACELGVYNTVGIDCVAMNVNDMIVQGAEPLFFLDYLGLHKQEPATTASIVSGVAKGCEMSSCALIGGECAEMPDIYEEGDFDIAGFAVGVVELERAIDASRVEPGDVVIAADSNRYEAIAKVAGKAPATDDGTFWRLAEVVKPTILDVPGRFKKVEQAWTFVGASQIGDGAEVILEIAAGRHRIAEVLSLSHAAGDRITLRGGGKQPEDTVLEFASAGGIVVSNGYRHSCK